MRLKCNMRFTLDGKMIHEVGEVIEMAYEDAKQAIRDRALIPLPDLPKAEPDPAQNAFNAAVKQPESVNTVFEAPSVLSGTSEVKEG